MRMEMILGVIFVVSLRRGIHPQQRVFINFWKPDGCGSEFLPFCACVFMFG